MLFSGKRPKSKIGKFAWYTLVTTVAIILSIFGYKKIFKKEGLKYYEPQYVPSGYVKVKPENDIVASDTRGLGVRLKYSNNEQSLEIITYEHKEDFTNFCNPTKNSEGKFSNVEHYLYKNYEICKYNYKKDYKLHYINTDFQTMKIRETYRPFLKEKEIEKIIDSFETKFK